MINERDIVASEAKETEDAWTQPGKDRTQSAQAVPTVRGGRSRRQVSDVINHCILCALKFVLFFFFCNFVRQYKPQMEKF